MQSKNEPRSCSRIEGRGRRKAAPRAAGAVVGVGLLLGSISVAQATQTPVWPVGKCVDGKLMAGEGFRILQGYNVDNTFVGRCAPASSGGLGLACKHGGVDIQEEGDATTLSVGEPVLAMANGEVLDIIGWGDEGVGVLVEHEDGTVAHYVHLQASYVARGEPVRQGQPLGAIMDYPYGGAGNDHLHLELRRPSLNVKTCANSGDRANCDAASDFHYECKGNGYALDVAGSQTVDANLYDFVDPSSALREAELPDLSELWTPPSQAPLLDLRFLPGEGGSVRNYGAGGGSASGSVTIERPYRELPEDFCDQVGRGSLAYEGSADTSFGGGVVLDLELLLEPIDSEEYLDVVRGGDDEHTSWRLAVRKSPDTGRRELAFQVTLAPQEEGATEPVVAEIVGQLPEPECRAAAAEASCSSGVAGEPSACAVPETCDPSLVELHCMSDLGYRQWRHVAASYDDQSGTFELLLDGEPLARGLADGELQAPAGTFTVYVGDGAVGAMDDVRVWALASAEGDEDDKGDALGGFGNVPRDTQNGGCECQASSTSTGAGGSLLLLLLGLWGLRRRRYPGAQR